jgi:predicted amidohydrolase
MQRILPLLAAQAAPRLIGEPVSAFADEVTAAHQTKPDSNWWSSLSSTSLATGVPTSSAPRPCRTPPSRWTAHASKNCSSSPRTWASGWCRAVSASAAPEGQLFNTQLVLSPEGELAGYYRKIFPWRPFEPYDPGDRFTTVDLAGIGRVGLNICYDAWYPEVSRQLAWMGAEVILNVVKTTTPDRRQELVLAKANAIVNQVFVVSVNCAGPTGQGKSIIVDPEGNTVAEAGNDAPVLLTADLDLAAVEHVRTHGTENLNRPWSQFRDGEAAVELPVYQGRINPLTWTPPSFNA